MHLYKIFFLDREPVYSIGSSVAQAFINDGYSAKDLMMVATWQMV